jgi:ureidoacrylate peracid hydrolase
VVLIGPNDRDAWSVTDEGAHVDLRRPVRPSRPVTVEAAPQRLTVDLAATAIVVVDMQRDFCHPDGWLASIGVDVSPVRSPIAPLTALLPALRARGVPVVWLNWGTRPDRANLPPGVLHVYSPDGAQPGIGHPGRSGDRTLTAGSWSAEIVEELTVDPTDIHVRKHRMSGWFDTELPSVLRHLRVDTLLFAGVNADQCVLHTLADAACAGFDVVMLTDCCATTSPAVCWDATIYNVRQIFGFTTDSRSLLGAFT